MTNKTNRTYWTYRIVLSGGGSGGPVSPLLAIAEELISNNDANYDFLWIGTSGGPERLMVEKEKIRFFSIPSGKLRRYFSFKNFTNIFSIILGTIRAFLILGRFRPDLVLSAGGFVSVPVIWASALLRIPVLIHQQDLVPGLANKLMAPFARTITVTFDRSLKDFGHKAVLTGNPVRKAFAEASTKEKAISDFGFSSRLPVILILGGGTGSSAINSLVAESLSQLISRFQIIHVTGKGKAMSTMSTESRSYKSYEFLDVRRMALAYQASDLVVSRCGLGALTEISYTRKPSILIPMPDSHQEENARLFSEKNAAIVLDQKTLKPDDFIAQIERIMSDDGLRRSLAERLSFVMESEANKKITAEIYKIIN